jgi:hypothetical protein
MHPNRVALRGREPGVSVSCRSAARRTRQGGASVQSCYLVTFENCRSADVSMQERDQLVFTLLPLYGGAVPLYGGVSQVAAITTAVRRRLSHTQAGTPSAALQKRMSWRIA